MKDLQALIEKIANNPLAVKLFEEMVGMDIYKFQQTVKDGKAWDLEHTKQKLEAFRSKLSAR